MDQKGELRAQERPSLALFSMMMLSRDVIHAVRPTTRSKVLAASSATVSPASTSSAAANGTKFRPCIDIHKGKVKQIVGSTLFDLPDVK